MGNMINRAFLTAAVLISLGASAIPSYASNNFDFNGGVGGGTNVSSGIGNGSMASTPLSSTGGGAGGGQIAQQTCDSSVWQTMETRARLETEREIMQNQNLIFKPDSVLTYACFDNFAAHASKFVGVLFTHTSYWGKLIINWGSTDPGVDDAIQKTAVDSMKAYLQSNFDHEPLGGRGREIGLSKYSPQDVGGQGRSYSCSQMASVWSKAKCYNFMQTDTAAKNDGFYPFKTLKGDKQVDGYEAKNDVRQFPTACNSQTPVPGGWATATDQSRNDKDSVYPFSEPNNKTFTDVRKLVDPGSCGQAISTGVQVILTPGASSGKKDGVCTNPGCTYKDESCSSS